MPDTRLSLLLVTVWARKGGAERIVLEILDRLGEEFRTSLGFVRPIADGERTFRWGGPTVGLREILFGEWDVIHTHLFLPGLLVRIRRMWDGSFRWVHSVHYEGYDSLRFGPLKRWLDRRFIFPATDVLVSVSPSQEEMRARHPHARLIQNAIPLEPHEPLRDGGPADRSVPVVGTVAHLRAEKGLDDLVRAVAWTRRDGRKDVRLRIAGDGPLRDELERLVRTLDLHDAVELYGFVEDVDAFYRELDVYVQPSRSERFGLATLEAMSFGLPTVAADVGFLPEMLGHGRFGTLVPRDGDFPDRLADALLRVLENPSLHAERARAGLDHWRRRIDPEAMVRGYVAAYRDALLPRVCMVQPIVTHGYGGLARQLRLQSRELAARGHRVFVVQRDDPRLASEEHARTWAHAHVLGAGSVSDGRPGPGRVFERVRGLRFLIGAVVRLWQLRHRVDVVHAHQLYSPTLVGAVAKALFGTPLVVKVTSSGDLGEKAQLERLPLRRLRKLAFRSVDRVIALTDSMRREVRSLGFGEDRIRVVPNAVEIPDDGPTWSPSPADRPFRALFVGRLSTEKRLDTLLGAARRLGERGRTLRVDLVGEGDVDRNAEPELRRLAADLPSSVDVRFHGFRADVRPFYDDADAFVLPSSTEGLSNALLEAMAHGLPCVVSDIPQNRFAVDDAALLFPMGSPPALADALDRLIRDRASGATLARRLGERAGERARNRFSVAVVVDRLTGIYDELLPPAPVARAPSAPAVAASSPPPASARSRK